MEECRASPADPSCDLWMDPDDVRGPVVVMEGGEKRNNIIKIIGVSGLYN